MKVLGLIPARAGSVRIPDKNIFPLGGKPLIAWTLQTAREAACLDRILVSTDSEMIAAIARQWGGEAPFLRPASISQADSLEIDFYLHTLEWLQREEGYEPDLIVTLYPTSPFRRAASIRAAVEKMKSHPEADSLRSVKKCAEHPCKMWRFEIQEDQERLVPVFSGQKPNMATLAYHQLPEVYVQNASIYITRPRTLREKQSPIGDVILPFVMSEEESLDLNTPEDLRRAELRLAQEPRYENAPQTAS